MDNLIMADIMRRLQIVIQRSVDHGREDITKRSEFLRKKSQDLAHIVACVVSSNDTEAALIITWLPTTSPQEVQVIW